MEIAPSHDGLLKDLQRVRRDEVEVLDGEGLVEGDDVKHSIHDF